MLVSIVIPCYYSEKTIGKVVELCIREFDSHPDYQCEFVLVNDGSTDGTFDQIRALGEKYPFVKGINLLRNFGQHNALMAGLHYVSGDLILGMDDDMQTHPSQIFRLIDKIREGYDVVYGHYAHRKNGMLKNLSSRINEFTSRILLSRPKEITSSNFWIITALVAREVIKYDGFAPYVDGVFYRVTHNIGNVEVEHHEREVGQSGYTLKRLVRLWLAYWNYSVIPLRICSVIGLLFSGLGFVMTLVTFIRKIVDPTMMLGWSSLACLTCLSSGLILLSLGIMGEYVGKMILTLNHTPQFIVRSEINTGTGHEKEKADDTGSRHLPGSAD